MNKKDLVTSVANATGYAKKDVTVVIDSVFDSITDTVKNGEDVSIAGFGKFMIKESAARVCRNPQTGAQISVDATKNMKFRVSSNIKKIFN